jgi:hypothetical protein
MIDPDAVQLDQFLLRPPKGENGESAGTFVVTIGHEDAPIFGQYPGPLATNGPDSVSNGAGHIRTSVDTRGKFEHATGKESSVPVGDVAGDDDRHDATLAPSPCRVLQPVLVLLGWACPRPALP